MCFECLTLRCSVENDESIHTEEMKQAAEQAKQEFLEQHPELAVTCASFNAQALVPVIGELPYNKMISSISWRNILHQILKAVDAVSKLLARS